MGTSAVIQIEGINYAEVYKHYDGYPENTLPWLEKFNKEFTKERGPGGASYKLAQLLRSSQRMQEEFGLDPSETTGWGVEEYSGTDCWANYTYMLMKDGSVEIVNGLEEDEELGDDEVEELIGDIDEEEGKSCEKSKTYGNF